MRKAIVEVKEVHNVPIEVEYPEGSTVAEIVVLATEKYADCAEDVGEPEYNHTLSSDVWTIRDAETDVHIDDSTRDK